MDPFPKGDLLKFEISSTIRMNLILSHHETYQGQFEATTSSTTRRRPGVSLGMLIEVMSTIYGAVPYIYDIWSYTPSST
jgi:hypothetical protein